ncbi:MAG: zinc metallopeptidase [Candidatus Thiodiazotropha sp. (ex Epidulcina cf. delphinae)]|nr:zinc metallopeptidase [Candidatus Thiodiazotropha sp. (ex Epidulcina cf. delphinae)]
MVYLSLLALLLLLILGPQLWVQRVMARYNRYPEENFPGNGGELARHLLDHFTLHQVVVEATETGDHYDSVAKTVRLSKDKLEGRTLTAITLAAHEVGHALQDAGDEPLFRWRTRFGTFAMGAQRLGSFLLFAAPILSIASRAPSVGMISLLAGFLVIGSNVLLQLATLPVELDASFKKALPILQTGYLTPEQHTGAKRILWAAALTYLSASLAGLLNFWQWMRVLKR